MDGQVVGLLLECTVLYEQKLQELKVLFDLIRIPFGLRHFTEVRILELVKWFKGYKLLGMYKYKDQNSDAYQSCKFWLILVVYLYPRSQNTELKAP